MSIKRAVSAGIIALLAVIFSGCQLFSAGMLTLAPANTPEIESLTAKEAWDIIAPSAEALGARGVPVYMHHVSVNEYKFAEGKAYEWEVSFYSEGEREIRTVFYSPSYKGTHKDGLMLAGDADSVDEPLGGTGFEGWNIDSPEACGIAAKNGAGKITRINLQTSGLEPLNSYYGYYGTPVFVPDTCKLFWVAHDEYGDSYYIDANTGEYLGIRKL